MKIKLLVVGSAIAGLLAALNQLSFGLSGDEIPPVPVTVIPAVEEPAEAPILLAQLETDETLDVDAELVTDETLDVDAELDTGAVEDAVEAMESADGAADGDIELSAQQDLTGMEVDSADTGEDLITISLDNAPLADVVRMFSRISGANIVAGTNLQGSVTVSMHDVPWEPALSAILDSVNLVLVEKTAGIFTIISKADLAAEPVTMETLFLNYTSVSNVLPVVQQMLVSTNATASAFPSANAIVVQETASRLSAIRSTVKKIDKPRPQVYIEAKFIELNDSAIENLGVNWRVLEGYNVGVTPFGGYTNQRSRVNTYTDQLTYGNGRTRTVTRVNTTNDADERNNVIYGSDGNGSVSSGGSSRFGASASGINAFPTREIDAETGIETITLNEIVPVRNRLYTSDRNTVDRTVDSFEDTFSRIQDTVNLDSTTRMLSAVLSADELAVTLSALKQEDGVEVVSNPKVIVSNGETADIHVGRNEPNVTAVPTGDTGDRFAVALDQTNPYIEIGVKLEVTPTVNTEDNITVHIIPELSRKLGDLEVGGVGVSYPITSVRRIETEFQLASGKTVAIGGLTETSDSTSVNKIPVLGDIPVIGKYLFQHKSDTKIQDETIIFVTVGLANPQSLVEVSGIPSGGELIHRHLANEAAAAAVAELE